MLTVTITGHGSCQLKIEGEKRGSTRRIQTQYSSDCDPGMAAAFALSMARNHGHGGYVIVGPKTVMEHIPFELRQG